MKTFEDALRRHLADMDELRSSMILMLNYLDTIEPHTRHLKPEETGLRSLAEMIPVWRGNLKGRDGQR